MNAKRHHLGIISKQWKRYRELLTQRELPGLEIVCAGDQLPAGAGQTLELLLADPGRIAPALEQCPRLRWVQSTYAGVDPLMQPGLRRDYLLTNVRGVFGPQMCEYVFGYVLAHYGQQRLYHEQQQQRRWERHRRQSLGAMTLLILGTGDIGRQLARTGQHFGMQVQGVSQSGKAVADFDRVWPVTDLATALGEADVTVAVLPDTPATRGLLDSHRLSCCKAGSLLINVGRGSLLELDALPAALQSGRPAHVVLDVFPQEPLPVDHPLWDHPAVTITPHIAAQSFPEQVETIFVANYQRLIANAPLMYQIDFAKGY